MSYPPLSLSQNVSPVFGTQVPVNAILDKHFVDFDRTKDSEISLSSTPTGGQSQFYQNLINTVTSLNNEIVASDKLTERFLVEPEKVNVHDVMIALQKSKLNLDLTRTVVQKAIDGYNTIINLR